MDFSSSYYLCVEAHFKFLRVALILLFTLTPASANKNSFIVWYINNFIKNQPSKPAIS